MKNKRIFYIILLSLCVFPYTGKAQIGWQWGIGSSIYEGWRMYGFGEPSVVTDKYGNVYASGTNASDSVKFGSFTGYNPNYCDQLIIAKADSSGNYQGIISSPANEYDYPISMAVDTNSNLYTLQLSTPFGYSSPFSLLSKYLPSGVLNWSTNYGFNFLAGLGVDSNCNVYLSGDVYSNNGGLFIQEYLDNAWGVTIGGSNYAAISVSTGGSNGGTQNNMAVAKNGDIFIYGLSSPSNLVFRSTLLSDSVVLPLGSESFFMTKYNSIGIPQWAEIMNPHLQVVGMTTDDSNNVYMTGYLDSAVIIGTDTFGVQYAGHFFVCKYSSTGIFEWLRSETGGGYSGNGITIDSKGNIWLTGFMTGDYMIFNNDTLYVPSRSTDPTFIVNYDVNGNYISSMALPTGGTLGIAVDNMGSFYISGTINSNIVFGPDTLFYPDSLSDTNKATMFIAKYKYCCFNNDKIKTVNAPLNIVNLYPNPASTSLTITSSYNIINVSISNAIGQIILDKEYNTDKAELDIRELSPGIYFVKINDREVRKFIKK